MKAKNTNLPYLAYLLIIVGTFFLISNLGWFGWLTNWLWSMFFLAAGLSFLYFYQRNPAHWWALIPGFSLLGLGLAALSNKAGGFLFLGLIGVGFATIYTRNHKHWWAIIPAGVLFTLAILAGINSRFPAWDGGWFLFLGIALTFAVLFLLPEGQGKQRWAIFPAIGSLGFLPLLLFSSRLNVILVSVVLILAGLYLIWWRSTPHKKSVANLSKGA